MRRICLIILLLTIFAYPSPALADTTDPGVSGQELPVLDMGEVDNFIGELDNDLRQTMPDFDFKDMVHRLAQRDVQWNPMDIFKDALSYIFKEVVANSSLLGKLVILAVICAVLQNITAAFERGTTGQLTYTVTYLVLITIAIGSFALAINTGREVVEKMVGFMQALLPLLLTLLVAVGGVTSAAIFHPIIFSSLTIIGSVIKNIVLPLIFFSAVLAILSNLSPKFKVSQMSGLLKTVALGLMGLLSTIFLGLLTIQGVAGAVGDGVAFRTARFAADAFIPVVGGMFSEALEAVISSSVLIKNAVGIAGVLAVLGIAALPLLKIICLAFIYKIAGAIIQPVGDGQIVDCLNDLGNSLIAVFAAVATVTLLFFFAITIVVGVGNLAVMLR